MLVLLLVLLLVFLPLFPVFRFAPCVLSLVGVALGDTTVVKERYYRSTQRYYRLFG